MLADRRAVLVHPVVVGEDRGGADVGALADLRVTDIAEVRHLRAEADLRVLRLDEPADLALLPEVRPGPQVGERADGRVRTDHREDGVGTDHLGALPDLGVAQRAVRADRGLRADVGGPVELHPGEDHGVLGDRDVGVDPRRGGVHDRDARAHVPLEGAAVHLRAELGQLDPVVDALDHHHVGGDDRPHRATVGPGDREDVGEVHLALRVVGADAAERIAQHREVEGVDARVDLVDRELVVGGVLVLDDAQHLGSVLAAQDAAVPGGVGDPGGEHGDRGAGALVSGDQLAQGGRLQQGHVAVGHQHGALGGGDLVEAALHGAAGARHVVLVSDGDLGGVLGEMRGDAIALVAQDHDELGGAGALRGGDRMHEKRSTPDLVEDLRCTGLHARPGTGGQDDDSGGGRGFHVGSSSESTGDVQRHRRGGSGRSAIRTRT